MTSDPLEGGQQRRRGGRGVGRGKLNGNETFGETVEGEVPAYGTFTPDAEDIDAVAAAVQAEAADEVEQAIREDVGIDDVEASGYEVGANVDVVGVVEDAESTLPSGGVGIDVVEGVEASQMAAPPEKNGGQEDQEGGCRGSRAG